MTRPIYEPTPSRTDAVLGYGSEQLFRRPVPMAEAIYTNMSIVGRRNFAPRIMAGIPPQAFSGFGSQPWADLPRGYSIWPGGLVVQALEPFDQPGASRTSEFTDVHLVNVVTKETQTAANKAAASVSFAFSPEDAGLDTSGRTSYECIFVFRCEGSESTLHVDFSSPAYLNTNWNHTILTTSPLWGNDYYGNMGLSFLQYTPSPGDSIEFKVWFASSGATAYCAAIYWMPIAELHWGVADNVGNGWTTNLATNQTFLSATASTTTTEASYSADAIIDTQLVDGIEAAAYSVTSAGTWDLNSQWDYWDSTGNGSTAARYSMALCHEYVEARIGADAADQGSVEGFITRYDNSRHDEQAYVAQRSWGLVYLGPRPRWRGWTNQYGIWRPDPAGNFFPFANGLGTDIRIGQSFKFLDFLTPQFDETGARISFPELSSGAPWIA